MSKEKTPSIKVIFYVLVAFIALALFVLLTDVNVFSDVIHFPKINNVNLYHRIQQSNDLYYNRTFQILIFNPPTWVNVREQNNSLVDTCEWSNCRLTSNRSNLQTHSAIVFYLTAAPALPQTPPTLPSNRNRNQVWIFAWLESPIHHGGIRSIYQNEHWRNTVNWTMTYTYDADVFYPYGMLRKRTPPVKNYSDIFHRKTRMGAWVVSNCHTHSQRETYVKKLQQYGVKIDTFGGCAGKRLDNDKIRNEIDLNYKFYISFENSLCKDYITEKFFKYFQYDVVLVVRGGGNYSSLLSNDSFINTADFGSIKELAQHLLSVGASEKKYSTYLMNKDRFESIDISSRHRSFCYICEKLNNLERNRRTYTDLVKRVHNGTCFNPRDIK